MFLMFELMHAEMIGARPPENQKPNNRVELTTIYLGRRVNRSLMEVIL